MIFPLASVSADNGPGNKDGLVVLITPRSAVGGPDNGMVVNAINNLYIFDFELRTSTGAPYWVTSYSYDVNSIDPSSSQQNPDFTGAVLLITKTITSPTPIYKGTIRIPATEVVFHETPFGGITLTILAESDANGAGLTDGTGHLPAGQYSTVANALAAQARWNDADQADEGFTPIFLINGQLNGLVENGNPILNGGFEVGSFDPTGYPGQLGTYEFTISDFKGTAAPWYMDLQGSTDAPTSEHYFAGGSPKGGSYVSVHYDTADDGKGLTLGQIFPPVYKGTADTAVSFDVQVRDLAGKITSAKLAVNVHGADDNGVDGLDQGFVTVPTYQWTHVTVPLTAFDSGWANRADMDGRFLTSLYIDFSIGSRNGGVGALNPDADIIWSFDNVRIENVAYTNGFSTRNDLNDGFSAFMAPLDGVTTVGQSVQNLVALNGGDAYVYELSAMDYTGNIPREMNLAGTPVTFQLLDEGFIANGGSHASDYVFQATGADIFRVYNKEGGVSERVIVAVDAATLAGSLGGATGTVVPWMFTQATVGGSYTDTFGSNSNPVSAYYSPVRNQLMGFTMADQLDYMATPIQLSGVVGGAGASASSLTLTCPGAEQGSTCAADDTPTLRVGYSTGSNVIETITVKLTSVADPTLVLGTQTVTTPGGVINFDITEAQMTALAATGDLRVVAKATGGRFVADATSPIKRLDNVIPVADFTIGPSGTLTKLTSVTLTDTSTDAEGPLASRLWEVSFVNDPTPDADDTIVGIVRTGTTPVFTFQVPDDGNYDVKLTVIDSDGEFAEKASSFFVENVVPSGAINGPALTRPNVPLTYTNSEDDDGFVVSREWTLKDMDDAVVASEIDPVGGFAHTFASDGAYTLGLVLTDDDGATFEITRAITVDGIAPVTTLTIPDEPGSGWFTSPVTIGFQGTDVGSGVHRTTFQLGNVQAIVEGSTDFERTTTSEGVIAISAFSQDLAGNIGDIVLGTVRVDSTPPQATIVDPSQARGTAHIVESGANLVLKASVVDNGAPVTTVKFYVDGTFVGLGNLVGAVYELPYEATLSAGFHEVTVVAANEAGLVTPVGAGQTYNMLVLPSI